MAEVRRRNRNKASVNFELWSIAVSCAALFILTISALLPAIFTVVLSGIFAAILAIGLPELLDNPDKHHANISLGIIGILTIVLLISDTGFLTISLCLAFGLLICFMNEIARLNSRKDLIYSLATNVISMICVVGAISWIIFTELYSWHFFVLPLTISVALSNGFISLLKLNKGFLSLKHHSLIVSIIALTISFAVSWITVKIAYKVGYQLYVTSAVLLDSSNIFTLNCSIPLVYSAIIAIVSLGYAFVKKAIVEFELKPQGIFSLIAVNLVPITIMSLPTYILLRVIGG
ncbi:hypothetical protein HCQ94_00315 [Actinomyces sp. zg-332]|uniref:hypothetical protein n=1 Tax=Actinomyces sp. zg-332 TaxID=2708340 RepID=UPI001423D4B0|nr:hypothetical protein [Actinomyces sp. zg-332]QPK94201.1 hypothetical protein HCQ94_00315 [Actinomyces sp. zg-332]